MRKVEKIESEGKTLVYIIRARLKTSNTEFFTPKTANLQVGYIVYPAGSIIPKHVHKKIIRKLDRTEEVLIVRKGSCEFDIYNDQRRLVATRKVKAGDVIVTVGGGHGFRVLQDLVLLEIKQGPYTGIDEKERF